MFSPLLRIHTQPVARFKAEEQTTTPCNRYAGGGGRSGQNSRARGGGTYPTTPSKLLSSAGRRPRLDLTIGGGREGRGGGRPQAASGFAEGASLHPPGSGPSARQRGSVGAERIDSLTHCRSLMKPSGSLRGPKLSCSPAIFCGEKGGGREKRGRAERRRLLHREGRRGGEGERSRPRGGANCAYLTHSLHATALPVSGLFAVAARSAQPRRSRGEGELAARTDGALGSFAGLYVARNHSGGQLQHAGDDEGGRQKNQRVQLAPGSQVQRLEAGEESCTC